MTPGSTDPGISGPVTVVCCDLKGSTALAERVDPESWRAVLTRYFHELEVVHVAHGGTVVKIIGDAIVTVFEGDDAALWATSAAVTAAASVAVLNDDFEQIWGLRIANRTGVATGVVADGDVLTSDVINVAESLESHAPPLGVLVDRSTRELLGDDATMLAVGAVQRKGRPGEVEAWRVESVAGHKSRPAARRPADTQRRAREPAHRHDRVRQPGAHGGEQLGAGGGGVASRDGALPRRRPGDHRAARRDRRELHRRLLDGRLRARRPQ